MTAEEPRENKDRDGFSVALENHLDVLWEAYLIRGRGFDLAAYIDVGGDIDKFTRKAIVRCLRGLNNPHHRNRKVSHDIEFYIRVSGELTSSLLALAMGAAAPAGVKLNLTGLFESLGPEFGVNRRGAKDKYARGRSEVEKLFKTPERSTDGINYHRPETKPLAPGKGHLDPYTVTMDPLILADYVERGGEIGDDVKAGILRALRGEEKPPHRNSDPWRDHQFYLDVNLHRSEKTSLEDTFADIAPSLELSERGVKERYQRGRRVHRDGLEIDDPE